MARAWLGRVQSLRATDSAPLGQKTNQRSESGALKPPFLQEISHAVVAGFEGFVFNGFLQGVTV